MLSPAGGLHDPETCCSEDDDTFGEKNKHNKMASLASFVAVASG